MLSSKKINIDFQLKNEWKGIVNDSLFTVSRISIDNYILTEDIFISSLIIIYNYAGLEFAKRVDNLSMNLIGEEIVFSIFFGGERFLKLFWILIFEILRCKSNIVVCEISQNLRASANSPIG